MLLLRVALAQIDTVVGDLAGNAERVLDALGQAADRGADLCIFPELTIPGYPPEDLLLKSGFIEDNLAALETVAAATRSCAAVVGFVEPLGSRPPEADPLDPPGRLGPGWAAAGSQGRLANAAAVCAGGRVAGVYRKRLLPNYGVFDEERWFVPGEGPPSLYRIGEALVGVSICEDVWFPKGPVAVQGAAGADVVVNLNASPYSRGRRAERLEILQERVAEAGCAIAYVNQVGGQDELVFDGASLVVGADGALLGAGRQFAADLVVVDVPLAPSASAPHVHPHLPAHRPQLPVVVLGATSPTATGGARPALGPPPRPVPLEPDAEVYEALVLGTRDYMAKNGFPGAVVGLSGGIDSSLVATVAVDAVGAERVHGMSMPSRFTSEASRRDAAALAANLGISLGEVSIAKAHELVAEMLAPVLDGPPVGLTDENLQARLRGLTLMSVSNARGWIVLATGNKSEIATGYSTLYGDSVGGFAVIKDVPKTLVYRLCRYRNAQARARGEVPPIPEAVLEKAPSAELRPDQRDDQSLPPYDELDPVLEAYVEGDRTASQLMADGFEPRLIQRVARLVDAAEYKRRQMPPGVRITAKAFGKDRRMPITNHYGLGRLAGGPATDGAGVLGGAQRG